MLYQVCTHHRCGTVLFRNTFRKFCEENKLVFFKGKFCDAPKDTSIHQSAHSNQNEMATERTIKGIHLFRDPIEMLASHIKYHEKSDSPLEASNKLIIDGVLYKDYLRNLKNSDEKAVFEINHIFGRTLRSMLAWDYNDKRYINFNLSEFKPDKIDVTCEKISKHFDFSEDKHSSLLKCFSFANNNKAVKSKHMTSGSSSKMEFSMETLAILDEKFPELKKFMEDNF